MFDTYTRNSFANKLTHDQLATKLAIIEDIVFNLHLEVEMFNECKTKDNAGAIEALTEVSNNLYKAIYN